MSNGLKNLEKEEAIEKIWRDIQRRSRAIYLRHVRRVFKRRKFIYRKYWLLPILVKSIELDLKSVELGKRNGNRFHKV